MLGSVQTPTVLQRYARKGIVLDTLCHDGSQRIAKVGIMGAVLSDDKVYRYQLTREWGPGPPLMFILLNPSTADADIGDPTIRRCIGFAKRDGYGGLVVVNLYAFRATSPKEMLSAADPVGPDNDSYLVKAIASSEGPVVAAWGNHARPSRVEAVRRLVCDVSLLHLGLTRSGQPRHPLYVNSAQEMVPWLHA